MRSDIPRRNRTRPLAQVRTGHVCTWPVMRGRTGLRPVTRPSAEPDAEDDLLPPPAFGSRTGRRSGRPTRWSGAPTSPGSSPPRSPAAPGRRSPGRGPGRLASLRPPLPLRGLDGRHPPDHDRPRTGGTGPAPGMVTPPLTHTVRTASTTRRDITGRCHLVCSCCCTGAQDAPAAWIGCPCNLRCRRVHGPPSGGPVWRPGSSPGASRRTGEQVRGVTRPQRLVQPEEEP